MVSTTSSTAFLVLVLRGTDKLWIAVLGAVKILLETTLTIGAHMLRKRTTC